MEEGRGAPASIEEKAGTGMPTRAPYASGSARARAREGMSLRSDQICIYLRYWIEISLVRLNSNVQSMFSYLWVAEYLGGENNQ